MGRVELDGDGGRGVGRQPDDSTPREGTTGELAGHGGPGRFERLAQRDVILRPPRVAGGGGGGGGKKRGGGGGGGSGEAPPPGPRGGAGPQNPLYACPRGSA